MAVIERRQVGHTKVRSEPVANGSVCWPEKLREVVPVYGGSLCDGGEGGHNSQESKEQEMHRWRNKKVIVTLEIRTSLCPNSGTDGLFNFWLCNGDIANGTVYFNNRTDLLGPLIIDGNRGEKLERGTYTSVETHSSRGNADSIGDNLKMLIIKKSENGFFNSFADGWKPDLIDVYWSDRFNNNAKNRFRFSQDEDQGWLESNGYYVITNKGQLYHLVDTDHLGIYDITHNRLFSNIERV
uniref:Fibrinogen C-terminal domain-containing protein n=1 Tax=Steinernema glaseri TaxID=37863 RepID=A0A1I8AG87_9BILA